ncbi:MAG: hypothetical protein GF313_00015 [Caldithrix sp.]|nr:hypothetical protein [Caldithrix sp.]
MMTKLREFSKVFIIIVVLSFIGLMVFEWGANYGGRQKENNVVGKVNGTELTYQEFSQLYQQLYQNQRARAGENVQFTESDLQQIRDQVWEQFIQRTLFKSQMEKLGIAVSDSEIVYQIMHYPLPDFKQHPSFQTEGEFDMSKYRQAMGNPNIPWQQVEDIYRQQIPFLKLQNMISSTARVSPEELRYEFKKNNVKVKVEYLGVNNSQFQDAGVKITDEQVEAFYKAHKEDYKQNERRKLKYVRFPIETTVEDTAHILEEFNRIRERLANGEDFNALASEYSEDPSVSQNSGDLGYFDRNSMVKPFSEAAFNASVGEIVGPVKTNFGFHLIKVEDKRTQEGTEQVKASHILLKVRPAPSHIEERSTEARFFSEDAQNEGFEQVAEQNEYEIQETTFFEEQTGFIPGIGNNRAVMNFAFASKKGEVSNVYRLEDEAFVVVKVEEIRAAGYRELETIRPLVENRVRLELAKENAKSFMLGLKEKIESGLSFDLIARQDTSKKLRNEVTKLFGLQDNVKGVGKSIVFNAHALNLSVGEVSDLVETERGYYYQRALEKTEFDSSAFAAQKQQIERRLLSQKRNELFNKWYENLKEEANIVDNRKMFNL